jgi:hypothetical protein
VQCRRKEQVVVCLVQPRQLQCVQVAD